MIDLEHIYLSFPPESEFMNLLNALLDIYPKSHIARMLGYRGVKPNHELMMQIKKCRMSLDKMIKIIPLLKKENLDPDIFKWIEEAKKITYFSKTLYEKEIEEIKRYLKERGVDDNKS